YTSVDHLLLTAVKELFSRLYTRQRPVRLIGVRFNNLVSGNYQINLFHDNTNNIQLYNAIDGIKHQYGEGMLVRAAGAVFHAGKSDRHPTAREVQNNNKSAEQLERIDQISRFATTRYNRRITE